MPELIPTITNLINNRGSEWNRWDLHVHTPLSHTSEYSGSTIEEKWENFIQGIESLSEEIKVIGINDYLFIDGYKRVLEYKKNGRMENIQLILPVIEFRLKEFVGSDKKINYHIIFDNALKPEQIEQQFLCKLYSSLSLDTESTSISWSGVISRESISELGKLVTESIPEDKRNNVGDFERGFNSISVSTDNIKSALGELGSPNTYLKEKYLTAIGKSEWEDFEWTSSPADKKTIINSVNFVFSASPDQDQANKNINKLKEQNVNNRLLHCSDAHKIKVTGSITQPLDMGHCFTWIKGELCFETLRQTSIDYENRILIQYRNPDDSKNNLSEYIDKIEYKNGNELQTLYFNKDMNSIIGKRGAGKSVLLKHIAFSVFGEKQVKIKKIDKLKVFKIYWCDNNSDNKFVEYIPQNYLSNITYEDGEKYKERDEEIKNLLFNNELFKNAEKNIGKKIDTMEIDISKYIKTLLSAHTNIENNKKTLNQYASIENINKSIGEKNKEIEKFGEIEITEIQIKTQTDLTENIQKLDNEIKILNQDILILGNFIKTRPQNISIISINENTINGLSDRTHELLIDKIDKISKEEMKKFIEETLNVFNENKTKKETEKNTKEQELKPINDSLEKNKSIKSIIEEINKLNTTKSAIDKLNKEIKDEEYFKNKVIDDIANLYSNYKKEIESMVGTLKDEFKDFTFITFDFIIGYNIESYKKDFIEQHINNNTSNSASLNSKDTDLNTGEIKTAIIDIISNNIKLKVSSNLETSITSLLKCRYNIDFTKSVKYKDGDNFIDFENMTGGQKAMAFLDLIFNLSKSTYPILIDQPENDIDVSGISNDLKKILIEQKKKRQVIIATHSPNLLLLSDSENVIVAQNENNTIKYTNGGIENKNIQENIINILEGGKEALEKRMKKLNIK